MKTSTLLCAAVVAILACKAYASDSCPEGQCFMACEYGFKRDVNGCEICECQELACRDVSCVTGKVCEVYSSEDDDFGPEARCLDPNLPERCKHPMETGTCSGSELRWYFDTEYDECQEFMYSGCHGNENQFQYRIDCDTACQPEVLGVKPGCSPVTCLMLCPHGFEVDDNGCDICRCAEATLRDEDPNVFSVPIGCDEPSELSCDLQCQFGYRRDDRGCHVCECHVPPHCTPVDCRDSCPFGRQLDSQGCETCACRSEDDCRELSCRMNCDYGFKEDIYGCHLCECRDDPCLTTDCPSGTFCKLDEDITPPVTSCVMEDAWDGRCPETMCSLHCEHGFKTDQYGCSNCECRDRPVEECPMVKCVPCHFGYAINEQGCRGCECLEDPCLTQTCENGEICEVTQGCATVGCRHTASCTAETHIKRAHVDLTLIHSPLIELNRDRFQRKFLSHISDLLGLDESLIRGIRVYRKDNHTLVVDFHIINDGSLDLVEEITTFRSHLDIDMSDATLTYEEIDFIPQPESLIATYHSTDWASMETAPASSTTTVIIIACLVGAILLLVLISVVVAKYMRNKKKRETPRKNIIYKKAKAPSPDVVKGEQFA